MTERSRATEAIMDELHGMQAENLLTTLRRYKNGEIKDEDGNALPTPPALLAQVNKFLKDNGIDRPAIEGAATDLLADEMPEFDDDNVTPFQKRS